MARIPQYYSKGGPPTEGLPRIPENIGTAVGRALERGGGQIADEGFRMLKEEQDLKFVSELADKHSEAQEKLSTLRRETLSSPEFFADPDRAEAAFTAQAKKLQDDYRKTMDPRMAAVFARQFGSEVRTHIDHVADAAFKQRMALGEGKFYGAITRLGKLADEAQTDEEAQKYMGQAHGIYALMEQRGLIKPENKVKEVEKFNSDRAERRMTTMAIRSPGVALDLLGGASGVPITHIKPIEPGNIDLTNRPVVPGPDGTVSTVRSIGVTIDGKEVLLPTVSDDGRVLSDQEAISQYQASGRHLGVFSSPEDRDAYAQELHLAQARKVGGRQGIATLLRPDRAAELAKVAEGRLQHMTNESQKAAADAEKARIARTNNDAYRKIYQDFNLVNPDADYAGAVAFIENPENAKSLGLDVGQIKEVSGMIETQRNQRRGAKDEAEKRRFDLVDAKFLDLYNKRQLTPDMVTEPMLGLPKSQRDSWLESIRKQSEEKPNPRLFDKVLAGIVTGDVKAKTQIPIPGQEVPGYGFLSGRDVVALRKAYDEEQDPSRSKYFIMLRDEFLRTFKDDESQKQGVNEFLAVLARDIKKKGLEGLDIYKHGRELMAETGRGYIDLMIKENAFPVKYQEEFADWTRPLGYDAGKSAKGWFGGRSEWQILEDARLPQEDELSLNPENLRPAAAQPSEPTSSLNPGGQNPKIAERVKQLQASGNYSDSKIASDLKAKGIDPGLYGLQIETPEGGQ